MDVHAARGLKYEDGTDVTAEDVAYAIKRSFVEGAAGRLRRTRPTFFLDGDKYKGPFQDKGEYARRRDQRHGHHHQDAAAASVLRHGLLRVLPGLHRHPGGEGQPGDLRSAPAGDRSLQAADYKPGSSLTLVKNDQWDPNTDPGRIQMVDGWEFKFAQDTAKLENIILNDNVLAQTTLTYDNVSASPYRQIASDKERLVTGTQPCKFMWYIG